MTKKVIFKKQALEDFHIQILPCCEKKRSDPGAIPLTEATVKDETEHSKKQFSVANLQIKYFILPRPYFISFKKLRVFQALMLFFANQVFQEEV